MARHLTWCFKRALHYTNSSNIYKRCTLLRTISPGSASIRTLKGGIIIPKFPQITEGSADYEDAKGYREFLIGTQFGKEPAARTLMKILSFTKPDARKVAEEYPALARIPTKSIVKIFEILREAGIRKTTIIENPFLLAETSGELIQKMNIVQKINIDINDAVHLFHLSVPMLTSYSFRSKMDATYFPEHNRMRYLAGKLNCEVGTICRWLSYNPHILMTAAPKLMTTTEYFLESGVQPRDILSDPVAYKYSLRTIKQKIELAKEHGINPLKLWVLRITPDSWDKCTKKYLREKDALSVFQNTTHAMCEIFDCDQEEIETLAYKMPGFWTIKPDKLLKNARFLRDAGYSIQDIQISPRILHRKYETLVQYIEFVSQKYGGKRIHLWKLLLSKKKLEKCLIEDEDRELKIP